MSTLKVNNISSYTGGVITISGSAVNITGATVNIDGNIGGSITSSLAATASYVSPLNQDLVVNGSITASGDLRFTTAGNAVVRPIINLVLNGTASLPPTSIIASTNTTSSSNYGINVVSTVTSASYCCRLPVAVKGKTITFVNIAGAPFYVFPSQVGGSINGTVNGYFQIPNDGKSYSFDCYENPLPGGWSSSVPTPTGNVTLTSDIITSSLGASGTTHDTLVFVSNAVQITGSNIGATGAATILLYPGNVPAYAGAFSISSVPFVYAYINPWNTPWTQLNSVRIVTNLTGSGTNLAANMQNSLGSEIYIAGTTTLYSGPQNPIYSGSLTGAPYTLDPGYAAIQSSVASFFYNDCGYTPGGFGYGSLLSTTANPSPNNSIASAGASPIRIDSVVPGTFTPGPDAYTSANPGDPGTLIIDLSFPASLSYLTKKIGLSYVDTFTRTTTGNYWNAGDSFDLWYFNNIGFSLINFGAALPNLKFYTEYNVDL